MGYPQGPQGPQQYPPQQPQGYPPQQYPPQGYPQQAPPPGYPPQQQGPPPGYGQAPPPPAQQGGYGQAGAGEPNWDRMYEGSDPGAGGSYAEGRYPATIMESAWQPTRAGDKNQWVIKARIDGGPNQGATITAYRSVSEYTNDGSPNTTGASILFGELAVLGIPVGEKYGGPPGSAGFWRMGWRGEQVAQAMVGKPCEIQIINDDYGAKVKRIRALRGAPAPAQGAPGQAPQQPYGGPGPAAAVQGPGGGTVPAGPGGYPQQGPPAQGQPAPGAPPMTPQGPPAPAGYPQQGPPQQAPGPYQAPQPNGYPQQPAQPASPPQGQGAPPRPPWQT